MDMFFFILLKNIHIILGIRVKYCTTIAETATLFSTEKVQHYYCGDCNSIQRRKSSAINVSLRKEKDSGA